LSEVSNEEQYSLTYLAHLAGLGEHAASLLGTLSYVVMLAAGIVAGRLAAARTGAPALLLLVPPAFAVFGGPFIHVQQLAIAIPAALVLSSGRLPGARFVRRRRLSPCSALWGVNSLGSRPAARRRSYIRLSARSLRAPCHPLRTSECGIRGRTRRDPQFACPPPNADNWTVRPSGWTCISRQRLALAY
jgi:hypothetical protein